MSIVLAPNEDAPSYHLPKLFALQRLQEDLTKAIQRALRAELRARRAAGVEHPSTAMATLVLKRVHATLQDRETWQTRP